MNSIEKWLRVNKEGIAVGLLVGYIVGLYYISHYAPQLMALSIQDAVFDKVTSGVMSVQEVVQVKAIWLFTLTGGLIGGVIDSIYKPRQ